jgi:hypothetical protein
MPWFVVLIASDGWGGNADEQNGDRGWRIWNLIDAESCLDPRWPLIEALVATRNPLFACDPKLKKVRRPLHGCNIRHRSRMWFVGRIAQHSTPKELMS